MKRVKCNKYQSTEKAETPSMCPCSMKRTCVCLLLKLLCKWYFS